MRLTSDQMHYHLYQAKLETEAPPLVLLHGLDSAAATFDNVISDLSADRDVLVYDQRGHGQSEAIGFDYSNQAMADDLKGLLEHLQIDKADLLGHSLGARVAVKFAAVYPETVGKLIIEDMETRMRCQLDNSAHRQMLVEAERRQAMFASPFYENYDQIVNALSRLYPGEAIESLIDRRARQLSDGRYQLLFRPHVQILFAQQSNSEDLNESLAELEIPVLVLLAADPNVSAATPQGVEEMRAEHVIIDVVPASGHTIHRSNESAFLKLVKRFLAESSE